MSHNTQYIPREYLSQTYYSIEVNPIAIDESIKLFNGKSNDINGLITLLVQRIELS